MKIAAIDTNVAIDLLNERREVIDAIAKFDTICLPITVCGELLFGAKNSTRKEVNETKLKAFIETCVLLETNFLVADEYSSIRLELKTKGRPIPENDLWIAAICIVNNIEFLSRDQHFEHIEKLKLKKIKQPT